MEDNKDNIALLDLIPCPGFCVKDRRIIRVNLAASRLFLSEGADLTPLLLTGSGEYDTLTEGNLYLTVSIAGQPWGASVVRMPDFDVFILDQEHASGELQALSLAAKELRTPLNAIMTDADRLNALKMESDASELTSRLNRGLAQLLRIVGNMSDAGTAAAESRMTLLDISALFREIFEKAQTLVAENGITLTYEDLTEQLLCLANADELERAVLNILSNSLKFTPKGGFIKASLTRRDRMLSLRITDSGSGIAEDIRGSIFHRYLRQPAIEDRRYGIGLGLVLVRSAAAHHGGTVLIDHPNGEGTRVTITIAIRQDRGNTLRSPALRVDYAGERDHALLELSDSLPAALYKK